MSPLIVCKSLYTMMDAKLAGPDSYILFRSSSGQCSNMLNPVIMEKTVEMEKWKKCVSTIWNNVKSILMDPAFYGCFNGNFLFMTLYGIF